MSNNWSIEKAREHFNIVPNKSTTVEKTKRKNEESQMQKKCVKLFNQLYPLYILFSIPNGGNRNEIEAVNLKKEGVVSGVADLCLLFGNGGYFALFIEMKTSKGKQSETQIAFQKYCEKNKYKYVVCRSVEEFMNEVNNYLN